MTQTLTPEERARTALGRFAGEDDFDLPTERVAQAIREAVAEEREECAKLADRISITHISPRQGIYIAEEIRRRQPP